MKLRKGFISIIVFNMLFFIFIGRVYANTATIDIIGEENYSYVKEVFDYVNEERTKNGLNELVLDEVLTDKAMQRAAEIVTYFSHTRPDGTTCYSILEGVSYGLAAENIAAGQETPDVVMNRWMNSEGHRNNILRDGIEAIGIGHINVDGEDYWVQLFTNVVNKELTKTSGLEDSTKKVIIDESLIDLSPSMTINLEETMEFSNNGETKNIFKDNSPFFYGVGGTKSKRNLSISDFTFKSENTKVATVDKNGLVTAIGPGSTVIEIKLGNIEYYLEVSVEDHRELLNNFVVNNAILDFKAGDIPKFTGKTDSNIYDIVEYWSEYSFDDYFYAATGSDMSTLEELYKNYTEINPDPMTKFEVGKRYSYTVGIRLKEEFKDKYKLPYFTEDGDSTIVLNGKKYTVTTDFYSFNGEDVVELLFKDLVSIDIDNEEKPNKIIDRIEIKNATLDFKVGDKPVFTAKAGDNIFTFVERWEEYYDYLPGTGGYTYTSVSSDDYSNELLEQDEYSQLLTEFKPGKRYLYSLDIYLKDSDEYNYMFPGVNESITVVVNGKEYVVKKYNDTKVWYFQDEIYIDMPFVVDNATLDFKADDVPVFSGEANTEEYTIDEFWVEVKDDNDIYFDEDEFWNRNGVSSDTSFNYFANHSIDKFEAGKKYAYFVRFNLFCDPDECRAYYLKPGKEVSVLINGKEYKTVMDDELSVWFTNPAPKLITILEKEIELDSIDLDKKVLDLKIGDVDTLVAKINPSNANIGTKLTWLSADERIAKVDQNGNVTALSYGSTTISVESENGKKDYATINVSKLDLDVEDYEDIEDVYGFKKLFELKDNNNLEVIFNSSNEDVIKVTHTLTKAEETNTSSNLLEAIGVGKSIITVKYINSIIYNNLEKIFNIIINPKEVSINNINIEDKIYDGNNKAIVKDYLIDGLVNDEEFELDKDINLDALFNNETVEDNKSVSISAALINNDKTKNYKLTNNNITSKASILPKEILDENVILDNEEYEYTGNKIEALLKVVVDGKELIKDQDYEITYDKNINAGIADVTINGINNYVGTVSKSFNINKKQVVVVIDKIDDQLYTGDEINPRVIVRYGDVPIKSNEYSLIISNNIDVGIAKIEVSSNNVNYEFEDYIGSFNIIPKTIHDEDVILEKNEVTYTGNEIKINISVKVDNIELSERDYDINYENNIEIGEATVIITGKGNYKGRVVKHFNIESKKEQIIEFKNSKLEKTYGDSNFINELIRVEGNGLIKYISSNEDIAKVDQNGNVTILKAGNVNISALVSETDEYLSNEISYMLIINKKESKELELDKEYKIKEGSIISDLPINILGFNWVDDKEVVKKGSSIYKAIYTENNDIDNYLEREIEVKVYGLSYITINTNVDGNNGSITESKEVLEGDIATIDFIPDEGYEIDKVLVDGDEYIVSNNSLDITATDKDIKVVVSYKEKLFSIIINNIDNITTDLDNNNVSYGTSKDISIIPNKGYKIVSIKVNGIDSKLENNLLSINNIKEDVTIDVVTEKIVYEFIDITNYVKDKDNKALFRIDAPYVLFNSIYIDNVLVDDKNYTSKSGSTIIEFTKEYMDTLKVGTHNIKAIFSDGGEANDKFIIKENIVTPTNNVVDNKEDIISNDEPPKTSVDDDYLYIGILPLIILLIITRKRIF